MKAPAATGQQELPLEIDYGWFHIMRPFLLSGGAARIKETAWLIYCLIKAHANHHTGRSFPSQETLSKLSGKSDDTIRAAVRTLEKEGLVRVERRGRNLEYVLLESAPVTDADTGAPKGTVDFQYVPKKFADQVNALRSFLETGIPPGRTLNLTVNIINQGDNSTVNLQNVAVGGSGLPAKIRDELDELAKKMRLIS